MNHVLIIDDEFGPRESLRFLLKEDYDVRTTSSVDEGVAALRERTPDLIIMDIKMPGKTGIEGLKEIRDIDTDVSIVMLTGFGSLETAQQAIRLGANDYVKKPFDTEEMLEIVAKYISRSQAAKNRTAAAEELKVLGDQMRSTIDEKDRLATLGQASSEFVHDLSNPIAVIYGYVELMMSELDASGDLNNNSSNEVLSCVTHIQSSVDRCRELLETWRSFGRRERENFVPVSVASVVREASEAAQPIAAGKGIRVEVENGPEDCHALGNSIQIFRAVQNLTGNAIQAIQGAGGVVRLRWSREGDNVSVQVIDNGPGIAPDKINQIFEPYFTTKKDSGGTGLGLYITQKVVAAHNGTVRIDNHPAGGAVATITLPCTNAKSAPATEKVAACA